MIVYLGGGFRSGWQDKVISSNPMIEFIDPRQNGLTEPDDYTKWDLEQLGRSDVLFAYVEMSNPALYALALEIGFAKAQSKYIILVDDRSPNDPVFRRYYAMCTACSDVRFANLSDGLKHLERLIRNGG